MIEPPEPVFYCQRAYESFLVPIPDICYSFTSGPFARTGKVSGLRQRTTVRRTRPASMLRARFNNSPITGNLFASVTRH